MGIKKFIESVSSVLGLECAEKETKKKSVKKLLKKLNAKRDELKITLKNKQQNKIKQELEEELQIIIIQIKNGKKILQKLETN